jgi:Ca2+-binding RTX toxin-like protein
MHSLSTSGTGRRLLLAALLSTTAVSLAPSAASAATRCRYDADTQTARVTILGDNPDGTVSTLEPCWPAEARKVVIKAGHGVGSDQLEIDAPERFHGVQLQWRILRGSLFLIGDGRTPVSYTVGEDGVNFGAGDGLDLIFVDPTPNLFLDANGAGGTLSGQGGAGTGGPTSEFLVLASGRNKPEPQPFFTTQGLGATLIGGEESDELLGASTADTILGMGGSDSITGAGGDDVLDGGAGNDFMKGGDGNDTLTGGAGTDYLDGGRGDDVIHANDGEADTVLGGPGVDQAEVDPFDSVSGVESLA